MRRIASGPCPAPAVIGFLCALTPALARQDAAGIPAKPQAAADTVAAVRFLGLEEGQQAFARAVVRVKPGDPVDANTLDQDVARLIRTGRFAAAAYTLETSDQGTIVIFEVRPRQRVTDVRFVGNSHVGDKALQDAVAVRKDDRLDDFAVREGREAILALYREKGYGQVAVQVDDAALERGEVVYVIDEGPRVRVRKIAFEGRQSLPEAELRKRIETRTALWIFRDGLFDQDRVENDAARVQTYYRGEGFLDAQASYRVEPGAQPGDLHLVFTIVEGERYTVEDIRFEGNTVYSGDELRRVIQSKKDDWVRPPLVDEDARTIQARYGDFGYIYATVRAVRIFSLEPRKVLVTFQIEEGEQFRVGEIVVRGNRDTKDKVVRRALDLYPPDDLFSLSKTREAEDRLRQSQVFSSARITPMGDQPGVRDVLIDVEESEKAGDVIFGFGVTSDSGLLGSLILDIHNFDITDTPRSLTEFFKLRSFHGGGQRLRLEAEPGTEVTRFRIDFTEPYLFDRPVSFGASLYLFTRGREDYDERRAGGNVSFGRRFERGWLRRWAGEIALRAENVNLRGLDIFAARDVREVEGSNALTSVKGTLVLDRTDNRFSPTTGDRIRLSYEQAGALGGDHAFGKLSAGYNWHRTVGTDLLGRKSVFSLRAETGVILGDAPVFERYYAGGIGTIRGFDFRGVGPRQGIDDTPVGGDFLLLCGAEYVFPLYGEILRGVLFTDMGTVESSVAIRDWRASIGFGVRLTVEQLGPIPIELDLAFPVTKGPDDEERAFSFFIGTSFF